MSRLIVVSNRVAPIKEGSPAAGGMAVAVLAAFKASGGLWFGWSGEVRNVSPAEPRVFEIGRLTCVTLDLTSRDFDEYYNGFANRVLWPLLHFRLDLTTFSRTDYAGYLRVNTLFASKLLPLLRKDDRIWIHDYHLIPMGEALRRAGVTGRIGFFLHTPFPPFEILRTLPCHGDLLRTLCAYDVVGFQTTRDLRAFHDYIAHESGGSVAPNGVVKAFNHTLFAGAFPIGSDTPDVVRLARRASAGAPAKRLRQSIRGRQLVIGVDRLDYSKGINRRFLAFERLLEIYPDNRNRAVLMQVAPPTRAGVPEYDDIRRELEETAGHVNGRFAEYDWMPIRYLNRTVARTTLLGFFRAADVGLVTPLRDGMNLVAKEYVAAQDPEDPGVLVLSRFAGAAEELTQALLVNPYDADEQAEALQHALTMPKRERVRRWEASMGTLTRNDVNAWRDAFLTRLDQAPLYGG